LSQVVRRRTQAGRGDDTKAFLWGAAHALDLGGFLLAEDDFGGMEQDAEALRGDWSFAISAADDEAAHVREEAEAK
jgi:hypothetical protein